MENRDIQSTTVPEMRQSRVRRLLQRRDSSSLVISLFSLIVAASSFWLSYSTSQLLYESVRFQLLEVSSVELRKDVIRVTANFIISNAANLDLSVVRMSCANRPIDRDEAHSKYCDIMLEPKQFPFLLKAGESRVIKAVGIIEPHIRAKRILTQYLKQNEGRASLSEFATELAASEVDLYGRSRVYENRIASSHSFSLSNGEDVTWWDYIWGTPQQGFVLAIISGRGNTLRSQHFGFYMPAGR